MRSDFPFHLRAVDALQYSSGNLAGAKPFYTNSLAEILIGPGKLTGNRFRRKFHANLPLHRAQFVDVDFHNCNLSVALFACRCVMDNSIFVLISTSENGYYGLHLLLNLT